MKELSSSIDIDAPAHAVWEVLTDFDSYPEWNPIEIEMRGEPVAGTVLQHTSKLPGKKPMQFKPTIAEATPNRALAWNGRLLLPGLFDVHHRFDLEPLDGDRTRLRQSEQFRGVLIPFLGGTLRKTHEAFEIANTAIKERVESFRSKPADEFE
jgi:hypothetical protein